MKKQNKYITYNFPWEYGWAILAAIITIAVLAYFDYQGPFGYQEEFTIYKEECVDENQEIGLDYYNEGSYGENYNIISYEIKDFGFYKLDDDFCIDYISSQTNKSFTLISSEFYDKGVGLECIGREITLINKNYYNISSKIEYLILVEKAKKIFPELNFDESKVYIENGVIYNKNKYFWVRIDIIRNKSICNPVDVEEIETNNLSCTFPIKGCSFTISNGEFKTSECPSYINQTFYKKYLLGIIPDPKGVSKIDMNGKLEVTYFSDNLGNYYAYFANQIVLMNCLKVTINKKDLTKEWLEKDCNCMDVCVDLECSNRNKCSKYKCLSDYEVITNGRD